MMVASLRMSKHVACLSLLIAVHTGIALEYRGHRRNDACTCLNWQAAYQQIGSCGYGLEYVLGSELPSDSTRGHPTDLDLSGKGASYMPNVSSYLDSLPYRWAELAEGLEDEFCKGFFQKRADNQCTKVAIVNAPSVWYGQSWCYVSSSCEKLYGGDELLDPITQKATGVRIKLCQAGEDSMMADSSPFEMLTRLEAIGYPQNDVVLPAKMGWPYMGENFRKIGGFWNLDCQNLPAMCNSGEEPEGTPRTVLGFPAVSHETARELQAIIDSGKTVVWNFWDHGSDAIVVKGKELWHLADNGAVCLQGCPPLSLSLSSYLPALAISDAGNSARGYPERNDKMTTCHYLLSGSGCLGEGQWP